MFDRLLEQDTQRIVQGARLMSADYAFREVISTGDRQTIASVLVNYGKRVDASLMMLIGLDQRVLGDTLGATRRQAVPFPNLIAQAEQNQQSSAMVLINGQLYQLVVVPVMAPVPVAWVAIGFAVNDALAQDFERLTQTAGIVPEPAKPRILAHPGHHLDGSGAARAPGRCRRQPLRKQR